MINSMQDVAFAVGMAIGACLLLAVSWVWIRKQVLGTGGGSLAVIGFALMGLAVFSSFRIEMGSDGIVAEFQRQIDELNNMIEEVDTNVQSVADASLSVSAEVSELRDAVIVNGTQFQNLARELQQRSTLPPAALDSISRSLVIPEQNPEAIQLRMRALESISKK
jgi:Skp family chaperone for outer membrane proteins